MREMSVEELLGRYAVGETDFSEIDFGEVDLSDIELSGVNLIRTNLTGANLIRTNLTGTNLIKTNLTGANLIRTNLTGANLSDAILMDANLKGANLSGSKREGILLCNTIMPDGTIENDPVRVITTQEFLIRYNSGQRMFPGLVLHRADLRGKDLCGINLSYWEVFQLLRYPAFLAEANLRGTNLKESVLKGVNFRGADLSGANLFNTVVDGADFSYASLRGANLCRSSMEGIDFTGADLCGAKIDGLHQFHCSLFCNTIMPGGKLLIEPIVFA